MLRGRGKRRVTDENPLDYTVDDPDAGHQKDMSSTAGIKSNVPSSDRRDTWKSDPSVVMVIKEDEEE